MNGGPGSPWEPPRAGTDAEQILGSLERMRATFRWKADGLDDDGLRHRVAASSLTLGALLKHLAMVEDHYFTHLVDEQAYPPIWGELGHDGTDDWEFRSAGADSAQTLYDLYDGSVERSRAALGRVLADGGLDRPVEFGAGEGNPSLRALLCGLIEEYGRHVGHADLLRESVDGRVGEDPPEAWRTRIFPH